MIGGWFLGCGALLLCLIGGSPVGAEERPQIRVGRVSLADGDVSIRAAAARQSADASRAAEWTDSGLNDPIATGMSVRTAAKGRAVLRVGAETIALAGGTELDIGQLDASGTQIVLRRGRIGVRLSQLDPARSIEIDIPKGGVWLLTPGDYDIVAGDDHEATRLSVIDGRARFVGKGADTAVATGAAAILRGRDPVQATAADAVADDFVAWWRPTSGDQGDLPALLYVSAEVTGYEALDAHGSWETVEGYGAVWFPTDASDDWAPYRLGHWRWVAPWGWTWIDDKRWGFATSHYGRWAKFAGADAEGQRWGWVPGKQIAHPAYAPAVVAFLGTAGVGLSYPDAFSPAVAWFPLAPGDVYWPSFSDDLAAIRRLNESAVDDPTTIGPGINDDPPASVVNGEYRNRRFASVVPRAVFLGGKAVAPALIELPQRRLENAPLLAGSPQILPPAPRPAVQVAATAPTRVAAPKIAKAMKALSRILKRRDTVITSRKTPSVKAAKASVAHSRAAGARPTRPRVIGAPPSRAASVRHADIRRH